MNIKRYFPAVIMAVILISAVSYAGDNKENSLSSGMFAEKDDSGGYECVRLRRGDVIELDGRISRISDSGRTVYLFTTLENRKFILQRKSQDGTGLPENRTIHLKGIIIFEGNSDQLPVLEPVSLD